MITDKERVNRLHTSVNLLRQDVMAKYDEISQTRSLSNALAQSRASAYASVIDLIDTMMRENNILKIHTVTVEKNDDGPRPGDACDNIGCGGILGSTDPQCGLSWSKND